jgi:hypothetical protein
MMGDTVHDAFTRTLFTFLVTSIIFVAFRFAMKETVSGKFTSSATPQCINTRHIRALICAHTHAAPSRQFLPSQAAWTFSSCVMVKSLVVY